MMACFSKSTYSAFTVKMMHMEQNKAICYLTQKLKIVFQMFTVLRYYGLRDDK